MANTYNSRIVLANGTVLIDLTEDTVTAERVLSGYTAHGANGAPITGSMENRGAVTGEILTKAGIYTIQPGYHNGNGFVAIAATEQAKLIAQNIREGVTILGVAGAMEDMKTQAKSVTPTFNLQEVKPTTPTYNCLSQVTVAPITVTYADNYAGGKTVTIGDV